MYPRNVTYTAIPAKHNLRNVITETKNSTKYLLKHSLSFRQFSFGTIFQNAANIKKEIFKLVEKGEIANILRRKILAVPENLKNQSTTIIRTWAHQCECVAAQRFRRSQQMFCLYTKLWEERALKEFLMKMKQQVTKRGKELMLGAIGVTGYNWEQNRITDNEIREYSNEIEYMKVLRENTKICKSCTSSNKKSVKCNCKDGKYVYVPYDNWSVFLEKKNMIIWRRDHPSGSYEYKVYGFFNDVCADDFLNVQIDMEYRKNWDTTAVVLNVIEKDPDPETNGDVIYWEMQWPKFFANRDYVFKRKFLVDAKTKTIILVSKHTVHPNYPAMSSKHRVENYWSHMIIMPCDDYNTPGLEFGLTYFDNPGVNIPSAVTTWVAYRAMPEFLDRLRDAAKKYQDYCKNIGCEALLNVREYVRKQRSKTEALVAVNSNDNVVIDKKVGDIICPSFEIMTSPSPIIQADVSNHTYWKYLQPTYYFS